jgi:hypothetical protein
MAAQLAGLPRPTGKPLRVKIRDRPETGSKPEHVMSHRVGQSHVRATVAQAGEIDLPRVAVEIALVIAAPRPVRTPGPAAMHSVGAVAVRRVPVVPAAVPVWALAAVAADAGGD